MRSPKHLFIFTAFFIFFAATAPVAHAALDDAGAQKLKTLFEGLISQYKSTAAPDGMGYVFDGDVIVEPADTYYAVTLPHIKINYPEGDVFEVGILSINATPHTKDGQWKMTMASPSPMIMFDKDRNHIMRVNLGGQQAVGIWDEALKNFAKLDATYNNVSVESSDPGYTMKIGNVEIRYDLNQDDAGRWSGPTYMTAKNLNLDAPEDKLKLNIASLQARVDLDQYDAAKIHSYKETLKQLRDKAHTMEQPTLTNQAEMTSTILDGIFKSGNGFKSQYGISGLSMEFPDKKSGTPVKLALKEGLFSFDLLGLLNASATMQTRLKYSDLDVQSAQNVPEDLHPENMNIDLKFINLPLKDIATAAQTAISATSSAPENLPLAGISVAMRIPGMMGQAGTALEIRDNFISNDDYNITFEGDARADAAAAKFATSELKTRFQGLDKVLAKSQVLGANPDNKSADYYKQLSANLEVLKSVAKIETGDNGEFIHVFDTVLNKEGQTLINGVSMMELMQKLNQLPAAE